MPERTSTRGGSGSRTATKERPSNRTPGTPKVNETQLREMKVDELRRLARERGVDGTSAMRKDDLVKAVAQGRTPGSGSTRTSTKAPTRASTTTSGKASTTTSGKASTRTSGETSAKTPDRQDASGRSAKAGARRGTRDDGGARQSAGDQPSAGVRRGRSSSKSLKYSQEIASPDEAPDRPGRSLVTTSHDVIRQWAQERDAIPATIEGTRHDDRAGTLRFDFPGGDDSGRLSHISWAEWFETFDARGLNFIYQKQRSDRRQSNFFRLENPGREDA